MKNIFKYLTITLCLFSNLYSLEAKKIQAIQAIDKETGLIIDKGVEIVKAHCTACHSAKFITLQRADRKGWKDMIVWMQKTQGLWAFDPVTETTILDYLSKNYAPDDKYSRRKNLKDFELPRNPYHK